MKNLFVESCVIAIVLAGTAIAQDGPLLTELSEEELTTAQQMARDMTSNVSCEVYSTFGERGEIDGQDADFISVSAGASWQVAEGYQHFETTIKIWYSYEHSEVTGNPIWTLMDSETTELGQEERVVGPMFMSDIAATDLAVDVMDTYNLPPVPFDIQVGAERMTVTGVAGNTLLVTRGVGGTLAEAHTTASTLQIYTGNFMGTAVALTGFAQVVNPDQQTYPILVELVGADSGVEDYVLFGYDIEAVTVLDFPTEELP